MVRAAGGRLVDVGPRSAHIAGLAYACFAPPGAIDQHAALVAVQPRPGDPGDYVAIEARDGTRYAITPTCAANALGVVPDTAFARADTLVAGEALAVLGRALGCDARRAAQDVLDVSARKVQGQIDQLIDEYQLDRATVELVGGGGGAAVLVPHTGTVMALPWRLAAQAEVISPIGVALAMVRDTVERNIVNPTPADILRVRQEAIDAAVRAGALAETVDVQVHVDAQRNLVRATAMGTAELRRRDLQASVVAVEERRRAAARSLRVREEAVKTVGTTSQFDVYEATVPEPRLFGWLTRGVRHVRVVDQGGIVRLQRRDALVSDSTVGQAESALRGLLSRLSAYGDAGRELPDVHVLVAARIIGLAGLSDEGQVLGLAATELKAHADDERIVLIGMSRAG
jgi:hypothetical protein